MGWSTARVTVTWATVTFEALIAMHSLTVYWPSITTSSALSVLDLSVTPSFASCRVAGMSYVPGASTMVAPLAALRTMPGRSPACDGSTSMIVPFGGASGAQDSGAPPPPPVDVVPPADVVPPIPAPPVPPTAPAPVPAVPAPAVPVPPEPAAPPALVPAAPPLVDEPSGEPHAQSERHVP